MSRFIELQSPAGLKETGAQKVFRREEYNFEHDEYDSELHVEFDGREGGYSFFH